MKKIALAGLIYEKSTGDVLLIDCAKYLCRKQFGDDIEFVEIDFYGRTDYPQKAIKLNNVKTPNQKNPKANFLNTVREIAKK